MAIQSHPLQLRQGPDPTRFPVQLPVGNASARSSIRSRIIPAVTSSAPTKRRVVLLGSRNENWSRHRRSWARPIRLCHSVCQAHLPNYSPTYPILAKAIPGADQLLVVSENQPWGSTVVSRLKDDPNAKTADAVPLLTTPGKGTAYDFTFHPKFATNHYLYVGWNGEYPEGKRKKKPAESRVLVNPGPPLTIDAEVRPRQSSSGNGRPRWRAVCSAPTA